eukprot:1630837-Prymnesium_polylepis.1
MANEASTRRASRVLTAAVACLIAIFASTLFVRLRSNAPTPPAYSTEPAQTSSSPMKASESSTVARGNIPARHTDVEQN